MSVCPLTAAGSPGPYSGTRTHTALDSLGQNRAAQSTCVGGLESAYADTSAPLCSHPVPSRPDSQESSGTPTWPHLHKLRPLSPDLCNALTWAGLWGGRHQQSWHWNVLSYWVAHHTMDSLGHLARSPKCWGEYPWFAPISGSLLGLSEGPLHRSPARASVEASTSSYILWCSASHDVYNSLNAWWMWAYYAPGLLWCPMQAPCITHVSM